MIKTAPLRKDLPLRNSTMKRFLRGLNPSFDFTTHEDEIVDYKGSFFKFPEIFSSDEMVDCLLDRGYGVSGFTVTTPEQDEHDYWADQVHRIAHEISLSRTKGLTRYQLNKISDWRNFSDGELKDAEKDLFQKYGVRRVWHTSSVTKPRRVWINKKFIKEKIHKWDEDEFLSEILIKKILKDGPKSQRDLSNYSRRYRALDEIGKSDVHFEMRRDGRVEYTKLIKGQGTGQMVFQAVEPDTEDFI